jgi:hypothetical protein
MRFLTTDGQMDTDSRNREKKGVIAKRAGIERIGAGPPGPPLRNSIPAGPAVPPLLYEGVV